MDPLTYIQNKIKLTLEKNKVTSVELDAIAQNLVPSVLQILVHDHKDTLQTTQTSIATLSDAEAFEHPQIKRILDASIEKVCALYKNEYADISNKTTTDNIIKNDLASLLKTSPTAWNTLSEKTYQQLMNDAIPGSNDERVFLWVGEIKKGTGITPDINETVGNYSKRAIASFLKSQPEIRV
jgi:hypothetical protein